MNGTTIDDRVVDVAILNAATNSPLLPNQSVGAIRLEPVESLAFDRQYRIVLSTGASVLRSPV